MALNICGEFFVTSVIFDDQMRTLPRKIIWRGRTYEVFESIDDGDTVAIRVQYSYLWLKRTKKGWRKLSH